MTFPKHDEIGTSRRVFEAIAIAVAAGLIAAQWLRFAAQWLRCFAHSIEPRWWTLAMIPLGMAAADLASGFVHWGADTWGSETMPILGRRLLHPFRVHHVNPDDFLSRSFLDTNGDVALIVIPLAATMFWIPLGNAIGDALAAFGLGLCTAGLFTNQVHQWAHIPRPPRPVRLLQACRLILSPRAHERHHAAPYATNYCIATGWCNAILNRTGFFRRLERAITRTTGLRPRADEVEFQSRLAAVERASVHGESPTA